MLNISTEMVELEALKRFSDFVKFHESLLKSNLSIHLKGLLVHCITLCVVRCVSVR